MDTQRLILFIVFSFSLLLLWENWQNHNAPQAPAPKTQQAAGPANSVPNAPVSPAAAPAVTAATGAMFAAGPQAVVKTPLMTVTISAEGGDLRRLVLDKYQETDSSGTLLPLFEQTPDHPYVAQSGLIGAQVPNHKTVFQLTPGTYTLQPGQKSLTVPLTWSDPATGVTVTKTYTFSPDSYLIQLSYSVKNGGSAPTPVNAYFQFVRNDKPPPGESHFIHAYTGPAIYTAQKKFQKIPFANIADHSAEFEKQADNGWVGMVQHHFVAAWLPAQGPQRDFYARDLGGGLFSTGVIVPEGTVAPGQTLSFDVPLYAGPQLQNQLAKIAPGLEYTRDYGLLTPIAVPIFWALEKIHAIVGNWGWAIVILTIFIKLLLFPLSAKSYKSMAHMRQLTPKLQKLKETYGDDRQKLHQAMAELYKTEKVNPLGGCLPIVMQIPVFIALYWVLLGAVELRGAPWILWIHDLTKADPYFVLPVLMGITMFIQTKLNPTPPDPMQAKVMMIMPIAFSIFFFFFPAGLVLYWLTNNILSIAQQWVITKQMEKQGKAAKA